MRDEGYGKALRDKYGQDSPEAVRQLAEVEGFLDYLERKGLRPAAISPAVVKRYAVERRKQGGNMEQALSALSEYGLFIRSEALRSEARLMVDAPHVMNKLSGVTRRMLGKEAWEKIFGGVGMPQIGWTLDEMSDFTREMEGRYMAHARREDYEQACETVAHAYRPEWYKNTRAHFLELGSIDKLLEEYNNGLIRQLEQCLAEKRLFFTQEVDEDVLAYVRENPQYYREGNIVYVKRMPYLTKRYLEATDSRMKRYYACHCPWARNAILQEGGGVSRSFCHCSMGFVKKDFEMALGRKLYGETVESVFDEGSLLCVFAIHIPDDLLKEYT